MSSNGWSAFISYGSRCTKNIYNWYKNNHSDVSIAMHNDGWEYSGHDCDLQDVPENWTLTVRLLDGYEGNIFSHNDDNRVCVVDGSWLSKALDKNNLPDRGASVHREYHNLCQKVTPEVFELIKKECQTKSYLTFNHF